MMSLLSKNSNSAVNKPASPRDSEDLLSMLRTRWSDGVFSDIKVAIFNREYSLHRVVLSRSPFFDRLLQGDWNESHDKLQIPSAIITCEAFELSLSHMYANPVMLSRKNVLQVIAAASYLGLQDLCMQGADYVIELMHDPEFFLEVYCQGTLLEFEAHTEKIQKAAWRHLCMMGIDHLRKMLPHIDIHTTKKLLQCEELWVKTEMDRYNLAKEIFFQKIVEAREICKEHGGTEGMPVWLNPALGSPRDPWIPVREGFEIPREKTASGAGSRNNGGGGGSSHNFPSESTEIKEDSSGINESSVGPEQAPIDSMNLKGLKLASELKSGEGPSSPGAVVDDGSSQGENVTYHRILGEEEGIISTIPKDSIGDIQRNVESFQTFVDNQKAAVGFSAGEAANGVIDIFNAVSDVFGLEGIRYSHIQHSDLYKIELELLDLGLNRAQHAVLQGMRTQDILYRRIEASVTSEEQETPTGRTITNYPKNLHPCDPKEIENLYSHWTLPSFRFGVEFDNVKNVEPNSEQISEPHYYAGSIWKVRLLIDDGKNEVRLHLFRNQRRVGKIGGIQTPLDSREVVCTRFKFLVPGRDGMAARSSRPGKFQQKKGRGWNDFLSLDNIETYLTPWGSLRVIVIVYPPFESD